MELKKLKIKNFLGIGEGEITFDNAGVVLIEGTNLDALLEDKGVNLTDRGILRHRITWVREMGADESGRQTEGGPTTDRIVIQEFGSSQALQA